MNILNRFFAYAQDFELTFRDDDWSRLDAYFAPDAVYEVRNVPFACSIAGRDAIFRAIKKSLDGFDRRFTERRIEMTRPPTADGDVVTVFWAVTYERAGAPPLALRGRSAARFAGDRIAHLTDTFEDGVGEQASAWISAHGADLDFSYV
jgi:hypothetical protein